MKLVASHGGGVNHGGGDADEDRAKVEEAMRGRKEAEEKLEEANGRVDETVSMLSALHERCLNPKPKPLDPKP